MKTLGKHLLLIVIIIFGVATHSWGVPIVYDDQAAFLPDLDSFTLYDFEQSSGFSLGQVNEYLGGDTYVGSPIDGFYIDGYVWENPAQAISGKQVLGGSDSGLRRNPGEYFVIDFECSAEKPNAIGFWNLDLVTYGTDVVDEPPYVETVRVEIKTTNDLNYLIYEFSLDQGEPDYTPKFFGFIDPEDTINEVFVLNYVGDPLSIIYPYIDDLYVGTKKVPEPSTLLLLGVGLVGLIGRKRKFQA